MKKIVFTLASVLALTGSATPAFARSFWGCMIESVRECDARFPPSDYRNVSIRGWCYMITTGICTAS
jgi:hypothetical protein